jgi:abortive infection bacteriophage resistance protein
VLTILRYLLEKVAPTSKWENRFRDLLIRYPEIQIKNMGFPDNWEDCTIWKNVG